MQNSRKNYANYYSIGHIKGYATNSGKPRNFRSFMGGKRDQLQANRNEMQLAKISNNCLITQRLNSEQGGGMEIFSMCFFKR